MKPVYTRKCLPSENADKRDRLHKTFRFDTEKHQNLFIHSQNSTRNNQLKTIYEDFRGVPEFYRGGGATIKIGRMVNLRASRHHFDVYKTNALKTFKDNAK